MLSFVGRGMCTSVSADQRSEALGARNAGECRLAQDGLEKDDAVFGVEDCYGDQGEDEESGERAAEHFEEPGPLVYRELRRDICNIVEVALPKVRFLPSSGLKGLKEARRGRELLRLSSDGAQGEQNLVFRSAFIMFCRQ